MFPNTVIAIINELLDRINQALARTLPSDVARTNAVLAQQLCPGISCHSGTDSVPLILVEFVAVIVRSVSAQQSKDNGRTL